MPAGERMWRALSIEESTECLQVTMPSMCEDCSVKHATFGTKGEGKKAIRRCAGRLPVVEQHADPVSTTPPRGGSHCPAAATTHS